VPPVAPSRKNFCTRGEYFTMSHGIFNLNFLALVLSEILGGSQIYTRRACDPRKPPSGKCFTYAQVISDIYTIVNFQFRSSINAALTGRYIYNRFCIERSPKWGFGGILGAGAKIFGGNHPRNAMTTGRLVKKIWRRSKYPSLYALQSNYKKKTK